MALDALSIRQKAVAIGIDNDQFQGCLKSGAKDRIERDLVQARDLGITSTPSFLIGILRPDRTLKVIRHESGAIPTPVFERIIDDALQTAQAGAK